MTYGGRTFFFGLFELPVWLPKNIDWAYVLQPAHIWGAWIMFGVVAIHATAALWHHFVRRDATLAQMSGNRRLAEETVRVMEFYDRLAIVSLTLLSREGGFDTPLADHNAIIDALQARNGRLAARLVRDHVIPTVGELQVQSSYRTPEINTCAGGAARSRHMRFQALDLLAVDRPDDHAQFYGTLCAMQSRAGQGSAMGLGAYFDGSDPFYNPNARFHIDGAGFRSWGRSYTAATSPCP